MGIWIPKGIPVTTVSEGEEIDFQEYQFFMSNLEEKGFSGQIIIQLPEIDQKYLLLMRMGTLTIIYEVIGEEEYDLTPVPLPVFAIKTSGYTFRVIYYALSPEIVEVLSLAFTFKEQNRNYPVTSQGDYRKIIENLYQKRITGIIKKTNADDSIILFQGSVLTDVLVDDYMDVRCSLPKIRQFEEELINSRSFINIWGEEHIKAQEMFDKLESRMSKVRLMTIKAEGSFLDQTWKVSQEVLADWQSIPAEIVGLRITAVGRPPMNVLMKSSMIRPKNMGSIDLIGIPKSSLRKLSLSEGEEIAVEPIYSDEVPPR